ncbi:hypothetical protein BJ742DRAFT_827443 [Cladochytrium replicatum]|nr:hypothetical protein BJ742DRAFT_827443 [Cladochytrium replicatum]
MILSDSIFDHQWVGAMRSYPSPPQPASAHHATYLANQRSQQQHFLDQHGFFTETHPSPFLNVSTAFAHQATSPTDLNDFHKILPLTSLSPSGLVTPLSTCSVERRSNAAYETSPSENENAPLQQWLDVPSVHAFGDTETHTVNTSAAPPHFDMVWDNYYDFSCASRGSAPFQTPANALKSISDASWLSVHVPMLIPSHPSLPLEAPLIPSSHDFLGLDAASSSPGIFPSPSPLPGLQMIVTPTVDPIHLSTIVPSHSPIYTADLHRGSLSPLHPPQYGPAFASRTVSPDISGTYYHLQQQQQLRIISPSPLQSQIYPTSVFTQPTYENPAPKDEPSSPDVSGSSADSDDSESDTSPINSNDTDEASMATTVNGMVVYICRYCPSIPNSSSKSSSSSSSIPQRMFRSASNLRNHIKLHHEVGRTFSCEAAGCDKMFFRKQDLERHASTHLPKGVKPFECDACGTRFTRADALSRHFRANRCGKRARNRNSSAQRKARRSNSD